MELAFHVACADVGLASARVADYHDLIQLKILIHLILSAFNAYTDYMSIGSALKAKAAFCCCQK